MRIKPPAGRYSTSKSPSSPLSSSQSMAGERKKKKKKKKNHMAALTLLRNTWWAGVMRFSSLRVSAVCFPAWVILKHPFSLICMMKETWHDDKTHKHCEGLPPAPAGKSNSYSLSHTVFICSPLLPMWTLHESIMSSSSWIDKTAED